MRHHLIIGLSLLTAACGDSASTPPSDQGAPADLLSDVTDAETPNLLQPDLLQADQLRTVSATQPVTFSHQELPLQGFLADTGWLPSGSPVQLHFSCSIASKLEATLPGTSTLVRDTQLALTYNGDPSAGVFTMDIGFTFGAKLRIDAAPLKWEGNLPLVPQFDFRFTDSASFTPFVLQGAPTRPVHLEQTKPKQKLFIVPIPSLSICLWGSFGCAGGAVEVKAGGTVMADLMGQEIATTLESGSTLQHTAEGQTATCSDPGTELQHATATYTADVFLGGTITIYPTVIITTPIPGLKWELAEFSIPVDLSTFGPLTNTWSFAPQSLAFAMD